VLGVAVFGTIVVQQFSRTMTSQLTKAGLPVSEAATIANKLEAFGGQASQVPLSGHLPLQEAALHQAIR
jgi:phosphohistidine phosphatase SixA